MTGVEGARPDVGLPVWEVVEAAGLVTVQDAGRAGFAHLGVPRAGWLDPAAASLTNRLVGNPEGAAVLEVLGGLRVRHRGTGRWIAVAGARCEVSVSGAVRGHGLPVWLPDGAELRLGPALSGARSYLAVAGGIDVALVLGSRSTDTLAWVGPPRVIDAAVLPLGDACGTPSPVDVVAPDRGGALRVSQGPRVDWFEEGSFALLCNEDYVVTTDSNRVGLRLDGSPLVRSRADELPSEGLVLGAIQVSHDGLPVVFLADHPTTGGYPVIAVVDPADLGRCAQLRPGDSVRFTELRSV
ncbi:MAG: biotin-dependent carboxyltransferase family protein [Nocardioides sp.]